MVQADPANETAGGGFLHEKCNAITDGGGQWVGLAAPPKARIKKINAVALWHRVTPTFRHRTLVLMPVLVVHLVLIGVAMNMPLALTHALRVEPLTIISIEGSPPIPRVTAPISVDVLPIKTVAAQPPILAPLEDTPFTTERGGGRVTPPRPSVLADIVPFARQAELTPGSGATVVLRVEVYGSGLVGRVGVDVSGGTRALDEAAIAYVRALKWVAGRVDDRSETMWVRWGVRLQA